MKRAHRFFLVVCFFLCPLIFFTNLTRNPYVTQISALNISLLLAAATLLLAGNAEERGPRLPRTALDIPLAGWAAACVLSWVVAYFGHAAFFKPAMINEGLRGFLFLLINAICPFYLAAACWRQSEPSGKVALGPWVAFALVWGFLWTAFPQMRGPSGPAADIWSHVWDGYGAFLWIGGLAAVLWLCRQGRWIDYLHLALAAGFLSSVYGVFQYFNVEFIWPTVLNPYGGRSVSTFGNPNFMSSYDVVMLPFAVALFIQGRGAARLLYGAVALALEAALLCSLTRSSWLGAAVAVGLLALSPEIRRAVREEPRPQGLLFGLAVAMALFWPQSSISSGYTPSVLGRISEIGLAAKEGGPYSPWHQRLLIWSCAWLMGAENPLTGKGWGLFELFYPFYQGPILSALDFYRLMRTHANNAHNEVMEIWAQMGLTGLAVMGWLWAAFFRALKPWTAGGRGPGVVMAVAAGASVAGMLVDNLLNVSLHFAVPGFIFWWTAGTAMAAASPSGGDRPFPGGGMRRVWAGALAVALAGLGWYWVKVWNREARYFAGFKLLRQGPMPTAVKELETSRDWGPPEVNALYELGNAYARSQRFAEADETYRQALKANAGYDEIYYNLGSIDGSHLGRTDAAIDFYRVSRWINPLSNEVYNSLGNLYLQTPARYAAPALDLLKDAVRFFPDDGNHWNNLGYLYTLRRDYDQAESAYVRALSLDPASTVAQRNLAALIQQARRPKPPILSALESLRELDARVAKRDYSEETLALAAKEAAQFPQMAKLRFLWGSLLLARNRPAEAVAPLEWAVAKEPGHSAAHMNLGQAYLSLGRSADAARELKAALALDPGNAQLRERLKALGLL